MSHHQVSNPGSSEVIAGQEGSNDDSGDSVGGKRGLGLKQLGLLSACHRVVRRSTTELELLQGVCRLLIEMGKYGLAWIGRGSDAAALVPVASAAIDPGYVGAREIDRALNSEELPAAQAIRARETRVMHISSVKGELDAWEVAARLWGFESVIAVPLLNRGDCLGVIEIHSKRPRQFVESHVRVLQQLAEEVAHGIAGLRTRAEHLQQRRALGHLKQLLRTQSRISGAVRHIRDREELLKETCRIAVDLGTYEEAAIWVVAPHVRSAELKFRAGSKRPLTPPFRVDIHASGECDTSLTGRALRTGQVTLCEDLTRHDIPVPGRDELIERGAHSIVALPFSIDGEPIAALTLTSHEPAPIRDEELRVFEDIAATISHALQNMQRESAAAYMASYDPITGLANRSIFCTWLDELRDGNVMGQMPPAIIAFDIIRLHDINDVFGRHVGDALLREVAERLKDFAGDEKRVAYLGGGTFLLAEFGLDSAGERLARSLETSLFDRPYAVAKQAVRVSCRSGVARYPEDGENGATLVRNAEAALKHAKEVGERYLHYKLSIHNDSFQRLALEHKLREAVDREQFELHYQPQINMATGRIESVEALLRWRDPEQGLVQPNRFLPLLESSGLIINVGAWALRQAARECDRWRREGYGPLRVAVNVSAVQFRRRSFVEELLDLLSRELAAPETNGIDLEITETMLLQDLPGAERALRAARAAGVRLALDDFGTGYSSLGLLTRLPIDALKIDRSFVRGLPGCLASLALTRSVIGLASAFGLRTIAEGVETTEQLECLQSLNCDYAQGFLHGPPVPAKELEAHLLRLSSVTRGS